MRKLLVPLVILVAIILVITGCSSTASPTPSSTPTPTPQQSTTVSTPTVATTVTPSAPITSTAVSTTTPTLPPASTTVSKYGGTMRFITGTTPSTPMGAPWELVGGSAITAQFCNNALLKENLDGSFGPKLATSYDVNSDPNNASITFHLRQGVKFQDGTDFNAQAVKWNLDMTKTANMSPGTTQFWKSVDVIDDYTVRVNLTIWQNRMIRSYSETVAWMVSPTAFQKNGLSWMEWHMVGTGAFIQTDFQTDTSLTAIRNPNYWDTGKPYVDSVKILYVVDSLTSEVLMKSGGGDILDCGGNGQVASDMQNAGYQIITQMAGAGVLVPDSLNADSPWSNLLVREAAEYAIDKTSLVKSLGFGFLQVANQVDRPNQVDYDSNLPVRNYDVAKAKQLLTQAGYPNGFKTTLIIPPTGITRDQAQAVQANLAAVGIQAALQFPAASQAQAIASGTWHNGLLFNVLRNFPNPNSGFMFAFGVPSSTMYQSLKKPDNWAAILTASVTAPTLDPATAQKCEDALYNDATVIPIYYTMGELAVTDQIHDIGFGSWGTISYWNPDDAWFSK